MPRTRITEEQILDQTLVTELEFNEFFNTVVITGTEDATQITQNFSNYFIQSGIIEAGAGVVVNTGTGSVVIGGSGELSPENFSYEIISSGVIVTIPQYQQMVVHEGFLLDPFGELVLSGTLMLEP